MINHARTLLLNRPANYFDGIPLSEYIPPTFKPIQLPVGLQALRDILIPNGITKYSENYIAAKLMQLLHAPELLDYTLAYDPRFTYDIGDDTVRNLITSPVQPASRQDSACDMVAKYRLYPDATPRSQVLAGEHRWTFSTGTADTARLAYSRAPGTIEDVVLTNGTQTSAVYTALNGFLRMYFELPSLTLTGKYSFQFDALIPPYYDLSVINAAVQLYVVQPKRGGNLFEANGNYADNISDLRFTWQNTPEFVLSLGAVVSAYVAQIEALRVQAITVDISSSE